MIDKLLSEKCIEYYNLLERFSETEAEITDKLLKIVKTYDHFAKSIEFCSFDPGNKTLRVVYEYMCCGDCECHECDIPVEWLDLFDSEIKEVVEAKRKEEMRKKEELANEMRKKDAEIRELRERREYERLKAKYEKETT